MPNLIAAIGFCPNDAWRAERLLDWIYQQNGRKAINGYCVLAPSHDTHAELRHKMTIAAELAFSSVNSIKIGPCSGSNRAEHINNLFRQTALNIYNTFKLPFLWLEPDTVPLRKGWLEELDDAYKDQPRRFMGAHLSVNVTEGQEPQLMLSRPAVYAPDAIRDLDGYCKSNAVFERVSASAMVPRSTKTRLIQHLPIVDDTPFDKVRDDACLLHPDKKGRLIDELRKQTKKGASA